MKSEAMPAARVWNEILLPLMLPASIGAKRSMDGPTLPESFDKSCSNMSAVTSWLIFPSGRAFVRVPNQT